MSRYVFELERRDGRRERLITSRYPNVDEAIIRMQHMRAMRPDVVAVELFRLTRFGRRRLVARATR